MALAFDLATNKALTGTGNTVTFSHTITGSNPALFLGISCETATVSSASYNGVAMTKAVGPPVSASNNVYLYYLGLPATGTNTVSVTFNSAAFGEMTAFSFTGAADDPHGATNLQHIASNATASTSLTTSQANSWIVDYVANNIGSTITKGASQTQRLNLAADSRTVGGSTQTTTTTGSYTMTWTGASGDTWDHVIAEVIQKLVINVQAPPIRIPNKNVGPMALRHNFRQPYLPQTNSSLAVAATNLFFNMM